ncbi:hypothetical protein OQJ46_11815 [Microbulbifer thermotolerans]|uniref:hypothetical protein n=1 Tax=Microbulbifer thermotolerans TaxID=252514 RepID=UPI0008EAFCE5|nr:hypothetical protein [Microbulbifer thermotolerans]MCX2783672.1 hypothetical protein [Microbulbifer thermotolerans]MCX2833032.1 hypothetical protein [Microbulbifer thermotolerans]SFC50486.1 hypothetical protein SAMN05660479_01794 [Microbulbifer thermotolerans]
MDTVSAARNHKNTIQTLSGTIASIGLEQSGKKVAGSLITPATWALNYAAEGSKPGAVDIGLWATGFVSAPAAITTSVIKAVMDDDTQRKLSHVRSKEPAKYAKFIHPCSNYGSSAPEIVAMSIANKGGTAWISNIGLWVYITDARGNLVADYQPLDFLKIYRPKKPYQAGLSGGFNWEVITK